jgi:hypothetical protein
MPTIVDSLFLELGIDVSKFSKDQQKALSKIAQFETQAKRSAGKAAEAVKTVGAAFRDLSKDSALGASTAHLDTFAKKLKALGQSAQVSGGAGTPFGLMAEGLGMLLSPAALGVAAVGLLGKGMWDLNKNMSAANATMFRQSQLSDMNANSLWAWGEAAKTVGANPQDITGGISSVQTAIAGMMVGAGNATPQIQALARLGLGWNAQSGLDDAQVTQMFNKVHQLAAQKGYKNLGGLKALTGPLMNDAMFALATSPNFDPATMQSQIKAMEPANLGEILKKSLMSQEVLGKLGIQKDLLAETAYGGEQGLLQAVVTILTSMLGLVSRIADFLTSPKKIADAAKTGWDATVDAASHVPDNAVKVGKLLKDLVSPSAHRMRDAMSRGMQNLMSAGASKDEAAAIMGSFAQESSMDPFASNRGHVGQGQWDKARQADFAKRYGYQMGSSAVSKEQQEKDQQLFALYELQTTQRKAASEMAKAKDLFGKTKSFMDLYERPGDDSLSRRFELAQQASRLADVAGMVAAGRSASVQHNVTSETNIGDVHVHTNATDPSSHVNAVRKGLSDATQPLADPAAQATLSLATRGMTG